MKKNLLLPFLIFSGLFAKAQFYNYVNEAGLSGSTFYTCLATSSGYVFAGSATDMAFQSNLFFTRTSTSGTVQQMRSFIDGGYSISCAIQTSDGNFGYYGTAINSTTFSGSLVLLKLDIVGNYLITKTYTDAVYSLTAKKMVQDAQGNFYLFASAYNNQTFQSSMCLIVTDPSGNITTQKLFNPGFDMDGMDIIPTSGGGVLLSGFANNGTSIESIVLIKLNASLNIDWSKWFSDASVRYFHYDIKEKSSGNFILCGRYDDTVNPYSTLIMEVDNSGNQVWAKKYSSTNNNETHAYAVVLTSSGAAVVGGGIDVTPGNGPVLAMSVDAGNGNLNWSKSINTGATREIIYEMQVTSGGDIIACGARNGKGAFHKVNDQFDNCADQTYSVTETAVTLSVSPINPVASNAGLTAGNWTATPATYTTIADGCFGIGVNELNTDATFSLFPNPVKDLIIISSELAVTEIRVFDALGKLVHEMRDLNGDDIQINTSTLKNGIYFIQLVSGQKYFTARFARVD